MLVTTLDAKVALEAEGLHVFSNNPHSLWIAATVRELEGDIKLSDDACSLIWSSERWVAVFPADGFVTYEVPGTLSDLVSLVLTVYHQHRLAGGSLKDAVPQVVLDSEQYLVGRSPACV